MTVALAHNVERWLRTFSKWAAVASIVVGSLVVAGWVLDVPVMQSFSPELLPMRANPGVAFVLLGVSLLLLQAGPEGSVHRTRRRIAFVCAGVAAALGLATFLEFLLGWELGIDAVLVRRPIDLPGVYHPLRMSPNAALNMFLLGCALLTLDLETRSGRRPSQYLATAASLAALLACLGYIYDEDTAPKLPRQRARGRGTTPGGGTLPNRGGFHV